MYKKIIVLVFTLLLTACNQNNDFKDAKLISGVKKKIQVPPSEASIVQKIAIEKEIKSEKIVLEKMKYENSEILASISAEKEKELRTLEFEQAKIHENSQKEIKIVSEISQKEMVLAKEKRIQLTKDKDISFYNTALIVLLLFLLSVSSLWMYMKRKNKRDELEMKEAELRHKEYMQASNQHHEKINKMLEIIVDKNTDKAVKKELVKLLRDQNESVGLLEHKPV